MSPRKPMKICNAPGCPQLTQETYCQQHRRQKEQQHNQRRGAAINSLTRQKVRDRDGHRCRLCGSPGPLQVHHIRAIADGGDRTDMNNLITLCTACHRRQHAS